MSDSNNVSNQRILKLKNLISSKGEWQVKSILKERLADTQFEVNPKVRLSSVLEKEPNAYLPNDLFNYLRSAELDYLISHGDPPNRPFLAIEFDGPHHELDAKQQENDIRKNRLCQMAGLPLLRVRQDDIEPIFTNDSFLSYVVEVILNALKGDNEFRRHDLADLKRLQTQLINQCSVISCYKQSRNPNTKFVYEFSLGGCDNSHEGFSVYDGHLTLKKKEQNSPEEKWPIVLEMTKTITLRTCYRTISEPRPPLDFSDPSSLESFIKWIEKDPLYSPDLPGINWTYFVWNILEALCLKQLLDGFKGGKLQSKHS